MKLNKGEWNELLIGLIALRQGKVSLFNSNKFLQVTHISYGDDLFLSISDIQNINLSDISSSIKSSRGTFSLDPQILSQCGFKKGSSKNKKDILLKYFYERQNFTDSFGIKALNLRPSLLNASRATNFTFLVKGRYKNLSHLKAKRLLAHIDKNDLIFMGCDSKIFASNLSMIDTSLEQFLSRILVSYFKGEANNVSDLVDITFKKHKNFKAIKNRIKDFLYYTCVGMFPTVAWDGREEIIGTLIYDNISDVYCLHRIDVNNFKKYLFENSFLDTASTTRHNFGFLDCKEGKTILKLNLLIRIKNY